MFSEQDTNFEEFDNDITIGKNLFLRNDKKKKYYLILIPLVKRVNLQSLAEKLGEKRFSFANEEELDLHLNIKPGSVSYLNIITAEKLGGKYKDVIIVIDNEILESKKVGFHPSDNTATVVTTPDSILKVLNEYDLKYSVLEL